MFQSAGTDEHHENIKTAVRRVWTEGLLITKQEC